MDSVRGWEWCMIKWRLCYNTFQGRYVRLPSPFSLRNHSISERSPSLLLPFGVTVKKLTTKHRCVIGWQSANRPEDQHIVHRQKWILGAHGRQKDSHPRKGRAGFWKVSPHQSEEHTTDNSWAVCFWNIFKSHLTSCNWDHGKANWTTGGPLSPNIFVQHNLKF